MAILLIEASIGQLVGMAGGNVIRQYFDWRIAFIASAVPGFLIAVIAWLVLRDPLRVSSAMADSAPAPNLGDFLAIMPKAYRLILIAAGIAALVSYAQSAFFAPFLMRA